MGTRTLRADMSRRFLLRTAHTDGVETEFNYRTGGDHGHHSDSIVSPAYINVWYQYAILVWFAITPGQK